MKKLKMIIFGLLISQCIVLGCHNKPNNKILKDSPDKNETDFPKEQLTNANVIDQEGDTSFKRIDSLVRLLDRDFTLLEVKELDSICLKSDGELSEYFWQLSIDLFEGNLKGLSGYFKNNPGSCLKERLIQGIGINIAMYPSAERPDKLSAELKRIQIKAKREKLSDLEIEFINELFKKVDPSIFD
jgi:hypothetical protein